MKKIFITVVVLVIAILLLVGLAIVLSVLLLNCSNEVKQCTTTFLPMLVSA